ncbi:hypothetical protein ACWEGQ_29380, partial [Streptomyces seoulensis]
MITVSAAGAFLGAPGAGLRTVPDDAGWVPARLLWLPVFAAALAVYWAVFRTYERRRPSGRSRAGRRPRRVDDLYAVAVGAVEG